MSIRTPLKIARVIVQAGSDPRLAPLLPPEAAGATAELLAGCGLLPNWMRALLARTGYQRLARDLERSMSPGVTLHMVLRKRFMDDHARSAFTDGASQCTVLGAGFDTLSLRMSREFPDSLFVEIDRPATQARKRIGLGRLGGHSPNLQLLDVELGQVPLEVALGDARGWDPAKKSVLIAEGLLMYLSGPEVEDLLRSFASVAGVGSRILFTFLTPDRRGRPQLGRLSWIARVALRALGEPLSWAIRREDLCAWLEPLGFELVYAPRVEDLRRRYLDPAGLSDRSLPKIEVFAVAERSTT